MIILDILVLGSKLPLSIGHGHKPYYVGVFKEQLGVPLTVYPWYLLCSLRDSSGQIMATSHDLTPNGGLVREVPLFQGNLGW